jgi:outer membrane biosynthesis protein TonB
MNLIITASFAMLMILMGVMTASHSSAPQARPTDSYNAQGTPSPTPSATPTPIPSPSPSPTDTPTPVPEPEPVPSPTPVRIGDSPE